MNDKINEIKEKEIMNNNNMEEKNMENKIINFVGKVGRKARNMWAHAIKEERGASELITVITLIVIVLVVAIAFKGQLLNIISTIGNKVVSWISTN